MNQQDRDIVIGIYSIASALLNPKRKNIRLVATSEGLDELRKKSDITEKTLKNISISRVSAHRLQEEAKKIYSDLGFNFQRIPSQIFLITSPVEILTVSWVWDQLKCGKPLKILCLDQITDVHNGAAIMRTAAFFGVDCIITSNKGNFGMGPSFGRIASGAIDYVKIIQCSSLSRVITRLQDLGVQCIGLSERAEKGDEIPMSLTDKTCLVLGAEDVGLSNAVSRVVSHKVALQPLGPIRSLNVSVAAAIAMEKYFGSKQEKS